MDELRVVGSDGVQYIVVRLGEEQYGIDIKYIDNIIRMQGITRVPKVPEYLKGVINLRGEVIPVMSARLKMFLPEDEITRTSRIIILKLEQHGTVGIIVDEVKEVVTLDSEHIEKVSYDSANTEGANFVNAIGKHDEQLISLLDLNLLLQEKENA
ncbi:MAG: purine-binding chemotaxis protein CheW [Lachnospiraceae bacterium]|nr:purine-binding chemotaxis protein CheW [Lachnospiraceae bacterium]